MEWFSSPSHAVCGAHHTRRGQNNGQTQQGAAVVEFALVLPLLLLLLIGGIDMSLALYDKAVITNASREGARAGIVARNPPISEAEIRQVVQAYTQSALINLGPGQTPPTVSIEQGSLGADLTLKVSVSTTFQGIGLGDLFSSLGQPWVLQSSTVMVYE
ncbi:MAG: TadE family protein [Pseudomonadota bacterium]|jgi:hypothetical protein